MFSFARRIIFLVSLVSLGLSCNRGPMHNDGMTVFRYNEAAGITSLDPAFSRNQANIWATSQLFNSLLQLDEDLNVRPSIAREYTISDDGKLYTFFLRDDVFFHDNACFAAGKGRKVVASDFVFSFSRLIDTRLNSPGAWVVNQVARNTDGSLAIEALNDSILTIRLQQPFPPFTGLLAMLYCAVVPHEAIAMYGQEFRNNPVGTGPFRYQYWKEGVKLVFRKNEHYFEFDGEQRMPYINAVSITFIIDRQTAFLEFIKGNMDYLSSVDATYKDEILTPEGTLQPRHQGRFKMISKPFLNTEYLGIMVDEASLPADWPLKERKVRQAINYGFDREKMMRFLRNNIGTPAHAGFVPVGMPGFTENKGGYEYDPDRARRLLTEAGFPGGQGLPVITLQTNQNYLDLSQYIQHELSKIGIRLAIDVMPPATLREAMAKGEARLFRASWIADYPDAENYLALFYSLNHSPAGPNYTRFTDKNFDRLYQRSLSITNDSLRHAIYRQLDQIVIENAPVVFLFYDQSVRFVPIEMEGMSVNALNHLDLRRVRFIQ